MPERRRRSRERSGGGDRERGHGGHAPGPRPFWSGTIAFGLVSLPVHLFPAQRSGRVSLRMIDRDGTPLERRYFCTREGIPLARDQIVRGYEVAPDEYVVIEDRELDELAPEKSREIDLRRFVELEAIDPIYFDRAYFLAPERGSTKAYRLLASAMESSSRAGIATFVMRGKEYLVAILAERGILRAETLRFGDELRSADDVGLPALPDAPEDVLADLGRELEALEADRVEPGSLEDREARRLLELVRTKLGAGEDVVETAPPPEPDEDEPVDLMEVLKRSLQGKGPAGGNGTGKKSGSRGGAGDGLTGLSKAELYHLAQERDIEGRSAMTKDELLDALEA